LWQRGGSGQLQSQWAEWLSLLLPRKTKEKNSSTNNNECCTVIVLASYL